jgi:hypothetical protein
MRIPLTGGGLFLGAAFVLSAGTRGRTPTVFNRGRARGDWPHGGEAMLDEAAGPGAAERRRQGRLAPARKAEPAGR